MVMIETIARLLPGVIKEETSRQDESYAVAKHMSNIEYPQYTRPEEVRGMKVPEILINGHHAKIEERKKENETSLSHSNKNTRI